MFHLRCARLKACIYVQLRQRWDLRLCRRLFRSLADDCGLPPSDVDITIRRTKAEGISFFTKTLPSFGKCFDKSLAAGVYLPFTAFSRDKRYGVLPKFLGSLLRRVFSSRGNLLQNPDVSAIRSIRQICFLFYKVDIPYRLNEHEKVLRNFVDTEAQVARFNFGNDPIVLVAKAVVTSVLDGFSLANFRAKDGPGVVSDFRHSEKVSRRFKPTRMYSAYGDLYWFNPSDQTDSLQRHPVWTHFDLFTDSHLRQAKVLLVPKDSRGPRLISCEPADSQYIQQGVMSQMVSLIERHPLTSGSVNFTDQSINQDAARQASIDQEYSTLDLKDASDRNSLLLFNLLFSGAKDLYPLVLASRSPHTRMPDGEVLPLSKFAPMGSAVCFPVMALSIFALLVAGLVGIGYDLISASKSVLVYGDDIIVPTEHAHFCISILERYGFAVNEGKSFINSRFCESCGGDFFDGYDVTPARLRKASIPGPDTLVSHVATANLLASKGYLQCASDLFDHIGSHIGSLPYGTPESPYLCRHVHPEDVDRFNRVYAEMYNGTRKGFFAWVQSTQKRTGYEDDYSYLRRQLPTCGMDDIILTQGQYDVPRSLILELKFIRF